jgi:hypothetical protein
MDSWIAVQVLKLRCIFRYFKQLGRSFLPIVPLNSYLVKMGHGLAPGFRSCSLMTSLVARFRTVHTPPGLATMNIIARFLVLAGLWSAAAMDE